MAWPERDRARHAALGSRLRAARAARGLSQAEVASRAQISRAYYAKVEQGHHNLSIDALWRIADALHVDVVELLEDV